MINQMREGICKHGKHFLSVPIGPPGQLKMRLIRGHNSSTEEFPFMLSEQVREHTFYEMQAVSQSVMLEQRSSNF